MAQLMMDHPASGCFGTSLAPIDIFLHHPSPSRLRKNSLVHRAKPLESTIFVGISEICLSMGRSPVLIEVNAVSEQVGGPFRHRRSRF